MAQLVLKSKQQLLGDMFKSILSKLDLNDINRGSVIRSILEAVASEQFQQYVEMVKILQAVNLKDRSGGDLDLTGQELELPRILTTRATGPLTIQRAATFQKVETTFYSGLPAAVQGVTSINVNDASNALFSTAGTLIIGRGTVNEEEVTYATAPVNNTNYWTFTVSAIVNNHGGEESVILKQGSDETIFAGELVSVPATGSNDAVNFTVDQDVVLLAGEDKIEGVTITASSPGSVGNIPSNTISGTEAFPTPPFTGARAFNPVKFSTGSNRESDDAYRDRISQRIQTLSKGTQSAILNEIIGIVDAETAKRVVSASVVLPTTLEDWVRVYIDDGTGFEPEFDYIGGETILTSALGGEERLKVNLTPVVKAFSENNLDEPYNISSLGNTSLTVQVGLVQEVIPFNLSSFSFPESATAEEVVKNINDNSNILEARTSKIGKRVVIQAKSDVNEKLKVISGGVNGILGFPEDERRTIFLYKNDTLLSKDGSTAFLDTATQPFAFTGGGPWDLDIVVDGKTANSQTVTFLASDFANAAIATAKEVQAVINAQLVGVETILVNNDTAVRMISLTKDSSTSSIQCTGGTARTILGISLTTAQGTDKDYIFNPQTGLLELTNPLVAKDSITVGSNFTRAKLRAATAEPYIFASIETMVLIVDGVAQPSISFPAASYTAQQIADIINSGSEGIRAFVRVVGSSNVLELETNTYAEGVGTLKVDAVDNAAASTLGLDINILKTSQRPHTAFVTSGNSGPYTFFKDDSLVVLLDNIPPTRTFTIPMSYSGTVTASTSGFIFSDSFFSNIFKSLDEIKDFDLVGVSGAAQMAINIDSFSDQGGNTWRLTFDSIPTNFSDFVVGDVISISNSTNSGNDGDFLITAKNNVASSEYIEVTNASAISEAASPSVAQVRARRNITAYNNVTGQITVGVALPVAPTLGDLFAVIPRTVQNMEDYFKNLRITTLTAKANVSSVEGNTKLQISSLEEGSTGYVQVTGGAANVQFNFSTSIFRGLQGYSKYTGLLFEVHKAIYGDDTDFAANEGVGAAGIRFEVKSATKEEVSLNIDITLKEGVSIVSVENEVKSSVSGYINSLGIGEDVILAEIVERIMGIGGITDTKIITPASNKIIADNELARVTDALIVVG